MTLKSRGPSWLALRMRVAGILWAASTMASGQALQTIQGTLGPEPLRVGLGSIVGDFDSDGIPDFLGYGLDVLSTYPVVLEYELAIRSGADLGVIHSRKVAASPGQTLSFREVGDWNGDGVSEVLVVRYSPFPDGEVRELRTWNTLSVLPDLTGYCFDSTPYPREEQAGIWADMNGDLTPDLIHSAHCDAGFSTVVRSGSTGGILWTLPQVFPELTLRPNLRAISDRTGDGVPELAYTRNANANGSRLVIANGVTGRSLVTSAALGSTYSSWTLHGGTGDLNQDSVPDFIASGEPASGPGQRLTAISGLDASLLWSRDYALASPTIDAAIVPDQTNDGRPDVLVISPATILSDGISRSRHELLDGSSGQLALTRLRDWHESGQPQLLRSGDHNGDGRGDVVAVYSAESDRRIEIIDCSTLSIVRASRGKPRGDRLGEKVHQQDLDGDGVLDLFLTAPGTREGGSVLVRSGQSGAEMVRFDAPRSLDSFGSSLLVVDDLTSDGVRDVIIAAPSDHSPLAHLGGNLFLYSGADGTLRQSYPGTLEWGQLGTVLKLLSDVDGDGIREIAVSAPSTAFFSSFANASLPRGPGLVFVVSPMTGAVLASMSAPLLRFGIGIELVGDRDFDGLADLLVIGHTDFLGNEIVSYYETEVRSSRTGSWLSFGPHFPGTGASSHVVIPDRTGDGLSEILTGPPTLVTIPGLRIWSSADQSPVAYLYDPTATATLRASPVADFDGDGNSEIFTTSGASPGGSVDSLFDGSTGALLGSHAYATNSATPPPRLVLGDTLIADRNGDGFQDWLIQRPGENVGGVREVGQVTVIASLGFPVGSSSFGSGCAGGIGAAPILGVYGGGPTRPNGLFALGIGRAPAHLATQVFAGTLPAPQGWPYLGCNLHLDPAGMIFPLAPVLPLTTTSAGLAGRPFLLPIPGDSSLSGLTLHFQGIVFDPLAPNGLFSSTNAVSLTIP